MVPAVKPVTGVVGESEFVIVPEPLISDQVPTPAVGVLAANVVDGVLMQSVWLGPALATLGTAFTTMLTDEEDDGQTPLEVVHSKTLVPVPNAVMPVVGESELVMLPAPESNVHVPLPAVVVFAAIVVVSVLAQRF